ncbi:2-dehydro-3-deoxygluconokinase [Brevibacillus fulvus]|uniref:2-dehydro-3-deoxygluconokinase n=1 Tax=Brevibacillus fulvus TaxID=1125967 RepID=A0A938Y0Y6_9BACL|nr:sugar kinase [Brevibacillus fulvus]MBM7591341.1 2-dehydro-3-deoxygluconokinase [Brevibacillus fulvus]
MLDVITIGDALVAMTPTSSGRLRFVHSFEKKVGGAELNVAIGCARLGLKAGWISRLGNDEFGHYILQCVRGEGIDTTHVQLVDGYPTSLYFKEIFDDGRAGSYYYRSNSPTSTMRPEQIDEAYVEQAKIVHISGVFPAVAKTNREVLLRLVQLAKQKGKLVTFDPNIRLKLWSAEEARETLLALMPYIDVVLAGEEEADLLVGTTEPAEIFARFAQLGIRHVVIKRGERGAVGNRDGEVLDHPAIPASVVVDSVGAGDGFAVGYLYSLLQGWDLQKSLHLANLIGSIVVGVRGDNEGLPYLDEIEVYLGQKQRIER